MRTLALDLSTKSSGWSLFNDKGLEAHGCITASSTDVISRIYKITEEVKNIFLKYTDISTVVLEEVRPENGQTGPGNIHTHKVLMWLQASIIFMLHDNSKNTKIEYLYPSSWRQTCGIKTGRGTYRESLKQADIDFVKDTYGITVNDDEADAIGIGYAYWSKQNNEINWE